jgi:hypothetical protein
LIHRSLDVVFQYLRWLVVGLLLIPLSVGATSIALDRSQVVSAKIWADKPSFTLKFTNSRFDSFQTPAQVEASLMQEMVATDSFTRTVLSKTEPQYGSWSRAHQEQAATDFRKSISIDSQGDHLFVVSYRTADAAHGVTVLRAVIDAFTAAVRELESGQVATAQNVLKGQLEAAHQDMNNAVAQLQTYKSAHGLGENAAQSDPAVAQLQGQAKTKTDQYLSVLAQVDEAEASQGAVASIQASIFHVVDQPAVTPQRLGPATPGVRYALSALAAVLIAEALLVYVLARRDPSVRSPEDVRRELGLKPLGSAPVVSSR